VPNPLAAETVITALTARLKPHGVDGAGTGRRVADIVAAIRGYSRRTT